MNRTTHTPMEDPVQRVRTDSSRGITRFAVALGALAVIGSGLVGLSAFRASRDALFDSIARSNLLVARDIAQHVRDGKFTDFTPEALRAIEYEWFNLRQDPDRFYVCAVNRDGRLVLHSGDSNLVGLAVRDAPLGRHTSDFGPRTIGDLLDTPGEWAGLSADLAGHDQIAAYVSLPETGGVLVVHATRRGVDEIVHQTMVPWWLAMGILTIVLFPVAIALLHRAYIAAQRRSTLAVDELCGSLDFQRLLLSELDHRVRNNLASLKSLIDISRTNHSDVVEYSSTIKGRIQAMAEVHTLLSVGRWTNVDLRSLLLRLVPDGHRPALEIDGSDVLVPARHAGAVGMVLHELITNSIKHGSLGAPGGRVSAAWSLDAGNSPDHPSILHLTWREHGGPAVSAPANSGIGSGLVRGLVESEMRGRAMLQYPPDGAHHELTMQLDAASTTFDEALTPVPDVAMVR